MRFRLSASSLLSDFVSSHLSYKVAGTLIEILKVFSDTYCCCCFRFFVKEGKLPGFQWSKPRPEWNYTVWDLTVHTNSGYMLLVWFIGLGCSSVGRASSRHAAEAGSILRYDKGFISQSQLWVQTLLRCPFSPCVQSHALTSMPTSKIPSTGSRTFVGTQENTARTVRNGQRWSCGCWKLSQVRRPKFPTRD